MIWFDTWKQCRVIILLDISFRMSFTYDTTEIKAKFFFFWTADFLYCVNKSEGFISNRRSSNKNHLLVHTPPSWNYVCPRPKRVSWCHKKFEMASLTAWVLLEGVKKLPHHGLHKCSPTLCSMVGAQQIDTEMSIKHPTIPA